MAKRENRTSMEMVRIVMEKANMDISYQGEALLTVVHVVNRVPSKLVELLLLSDGSIESHS